MQGPKEYPKGPNCVMFLSPEVEEEKEWAQRRVAVREQGWQLGQALIEKAEKLLSYPLAEQIKDEVIEEREDASGNKIPVVINRIIVKPARWGFADATKMFSTGVEMMRLSAGLSTEHISSDVMTTDLSTGSETISQDEIATRILELIEMARARQEAEPLNALAVESGDNSLEQPEGEPAPLRLIN